MTVFAVPSIRVRVAAEARRWIGTPFRHRMARRGTGCDCLGLIRGVYRALYETEAEAVPAYAPHWAAATRAELLVDGLSRHLVAIPVDGARAGDVVAFRLRRRLPVSHAAILTGPDRLVHAWERGPVAEFSFSLPWRHRVARSFAFPETVDRS